VRRLAAASLAAALLLSACGKGNEELSTTPIEKNIRAGLTRQTRVPIGPVTCPKEVKPQKGAVFYCSARYDSGGRARIRVTQRDASGNVVWRLMQG
jgi:hypothetical protein